MTSVVEISAVEASIVEANIAETSVVEAGAGPTVARSTWVAVCPYDRLEPELGVAALVDGCQVALFRCHDGSLYAVGNLDPIAGAYVMSRGIVGTRGDVPTVASPLHKQVYDLRTGACLDVPGVQLSTFDVRERDGLVEICRV